MIKLIICEDGKYNGHYDLEVADTDSYVNSRLMIDEVKADKKNSVTLLIKRPSFISYYYDIITNPGWSEIERYSIKSILDDYKNIITYDESTLLEELFEVKEDLIDYLSAYNADDSFEYNTIKYCFYSGDSLINAEDFFDCYKWVEECIINDRMDWIDPKKKELLTQYLSNKLENKYFNLLLVDSPDKWHDLNIRLVSSYLFEKYPASNKNLINSKIMLIKDLGLDAKMIDHIIENNTNILQEIDVKLSAIKDSLSLFEKDHEVYVFINKTKGYLNEEWKWIWSYIGANFNNSFPKEIIIDIKNWCKEYKREIDDLLLVLELFEEKERIELPTSIDEWIKFYDEFYLLYFSSINKDNNLLDRLQSIKDENGLFLKGIKREIEKWKLHIENEYEKYFLDNYNSLLRDGKMTNGMLPKLMHYNSHQKVIYFILDSMHWELWDIVRSCMEEKNYFLVNDKQFCLSTIPSTTYFSRTALLSGKTISKLIEEKETGVYSHGVGDEEKHLKNIFKGSDVAFKVGGIDDFNDLINHKADIYAYIYSQTDSIFHALSDSDLNLFYTFISTIINKIIDLINRMDDNYTIVIATDHGAVLTTGKTKLEMPQLPAELEYEQNGNSLMVYYSEKPYDEHDNSTDVSFIDSEKWHFIHRSKLNSFGLPEKLGEKDIFAWLFPKSSYFLGTKSKKYTHGGVSIQETIIPYGIFRRQAVSFNSLIVEISNMFLNINESSFVEFVVFNPNNFGIKGMNIRSRTTGAEMRLSDLLPKSSKKMRINFILDEKYCKNRLFDDVLELDISYLNTNVIQEYQYDKMVEVKPEKSISDELNKKRTLDF